MLPQKESSTNISSVDLEEMAFAMALFDGAANGHVSPPIAVNPTLSLSESRDAYDDISLESLRKALDISDQGSSDDVALAFGLAMLWHQYQGDERQQIICSRLLAFYDLIARRTRPILRANISLSNEESGALFRDPSIIRAVACAPLSDVAGFDEASFRGVASQDDRPSTSHALVTATNPFQNSNVTLPGTLTSSVRHLAKLLYIYEACSLPLSAQGELLKFHVLRKFCCAFREISGGVALQAFFSRALASTRSDFPWLSAACILKDGEVGGLETTRRLSPTQALEGELALVGTLVESLRSALGDDVTISLLKALWPLASFPNTPTS